MSKDIIVLLMVSLITVVTWIAFEIYHSNTSIYISQEIRNQSQPLDSDLDIKLIEYLKQLNHN